MPTISKHKGLTIIEADDGAEPLYDVWLDTVDGKRIARVYRDTDEDRPIWVGPVSRFIIATIILADAAKRFGGDDPKAFDAVRIRYDQDGSWAFTKERAVQPHAYAETGVGSLPGAFVPRPTGTYVLVREADGIKRRQRCSCGGFFYEDGHSGKHRVGCTTKETV